MTLYLSTVKSQIGILQNNTVSTSYIDGTDSYIVYGSTVTFTNPQSVTPSAILSSNSNGASGAVQVATYNATSTTFSGSIITMISWNMSYNANAYSRVNIDLATQQYVTQIILTTYNLQTGGGYGSV